MTPEPARLSTPNDTTVVLTRSFNAPRHLVWEAMTVPARMQRWMLPPPGLTTTVEVCEAKVAGALKVVMKNADGTQAMMLVGVFTEAVPHARMVHTETVVFGAGEVVASLVETHEFTEKNGITSVRITQVYPSKEARDGASAGLEGMEACYVQLDAQLAQQR